jgi:copper chaperone NosL
MVTRRRFLALLGATGVTAGGVALGISLLPGGGTSEETGPPAIRYGQATCDTCGMIIDDSRFAASWREAAGGVARFDDIGCMVALKREANPTAGTAFYVHDYSDEGWLDATTAHYVSSASIKSPMAYGLAAVGTVQAAAALGAETSGTGYDWVGLLGAVEPRG